MLGSSFYSRRYKSAKTAKRVLEKGPEDQRLHGVGSSKTRISRRKAIAADSMEMQIGISQPLGPHGRILYKL
eukprot:scaffold11809_cov128-Cylindrotheca_fusiformis.AAC.8